MSESENASEEFSTAAELRSFVENNLDEKNTDVFTHAGLVDNPQLLSFMNFMEFSYEQENNPDMPYKFKDTKIGKMLRMSTATKTTNKAVSEGNISQMKYVSGKHSYKTDTSAIHALRKMRNYLSNDAYIQYLFGHMGNGKTDFAILEGELSKEELGYKIASNIRSLEEKDKYVKSFGDLLQWLADGEQVSSIDEIKDRDLDTGNKLFIFDEASSHASGYSDDAYETQKKLGTMVKKIRKVNASMIIIGHTGKDIHPDIRRLAECVKKVSKKTAEYYHSVNEGKGEGHKRTISGIPKTNWNSYDTNEITTWDWSKIPTETREKTKNEMDTGDRNVQIVKAYESNSHPEIEANENGKITMEMIGEHYDLSRPRVSQIVAEAIN